MVIGKEGEVKPEFIVYILKQILCSKEIKEYLNTEAKKTDTPIDDLMVEVIYTLLGCEA